MYRALPDYNLKKLMRSRLFEVDPSTSWDTALTASKSTSLPCRSGGSPSIELVVTGNELSTVMAKSHLDFADVRRYHVQNTLLLLLHHLP